METVSTAVVPFWMKLLVNSSIDPRPANMYKEFSDGGS